MSDKAALPAIERPNGKLYRPAGIWKPVPGYEGSYEVSNRGQVWSVPRSDTRGCPQGGKLLEPFPDRKGYVRVSLRVGGKTRTLYVHQLVMLAFAGEAPDGEEVCHGAAGKLVNHWPENLSYGTKSKNHGEDRVRDGSDNRGEKHGNAKLTETDIREIRLLWASEQVPGHQHRIRCGHEVTWTQKRIGERFGVHATTIAKVVHYRNWKS